MAKKKFDPQAKAKRQKIFAAVGGVLLLGLLAFQVPRTLKLLHQSNATASSSQTSSATPATTQPIAPPSLGGGNATAGTSTTTADGLSDPNGAVTPQAGQLTALGRFQSKDPFAQQMDATCGASGPACSSGGSKGGTQGGASVTVASNTDNTVKAAGSVEPGSFPSSETGVRKAAAEGPESLRRSNARE